VAQPLKAEPVMTVQAKVGATQNADVKPAAKPAIRTPVKKETSSARQWQLRAGSKSRIVNWLRNYAFNL
jgi:hypothetical protein